MSRPLRIGITCFPTFGGSGLIATEIGAAMAARGHTVHFIASRPPVRLETGPRVRFHAVAESDYPALAGSNTYPIALASKMIDVATREQLDVLHVHYAVPHATAAWMACQVMGEKAPRIVTTLHGTDITLVGADPTYLPITRYSLQRSDAVTVPSEFLRGATKKGLALPDDFSIDVISNFVDTEEFAPRRDRAPLRDVWPKLRDDERVLIHVSNLRPVKRVGDVLAVFADVCREAPARLIVVGDGPERPAAERWVRERGLDEKVAFLGERDALAPLLAACDVFLLPSAQESFGLAALEAQSCGVPVVASDVGGLPEVIEHAHTGFLAPLGDVTRMAEHVMALLNDSAKWSAFSQRARARALERFQRAPAIERYEAVYQRVARQ